MSVNGTHTETVDVGGVPKLYTLVQSSASTSRTLEIDLQPRGGGLRLHLRLIVSGGLPDEWDRLAGRLGER